jgi:hypothetical protein
MTEGYFENAQLHILLIINMWIFGACTFFFTKFPFLIVLKVCETICCLICATTYDPSVYPCPTHPVMCLNQSVSWCPSL